MISANTHQSPEHDRRPRVMSWSSTRLPIIAPAVRSDTQTFRAQPPSKRWKLTMWVTHSLLVVGIVLLAYRPWEGHKTSADETQAVEPANPTRSVKVGQPAPTSAMHIELPATFRPWQTAILHARANGYLKAWHAELGARVSVGELLAEIETPELDQEFAQALAGAREADAAVAQARAERIEAEADLKVAESQLDRARAEAELARTQLARREKLLRTQATTQEEYDTFSRQVEARTADVAAAESDVSRRQANLHTRTAIIAAREATAESRSANVDRIQELLNFKRIVSPFDGIVTQRNAEVGMLVTAGREALFVIQDMHRIRVQINVPQSYAMIAVAGVPVSIKLPESNAAPLQGAITRVADAVDPASRTMLAEVELSNDSLALQPGSYARVTLQSPQEGNSWTVPTNTVQMHVAGPRVAVIDRDNKIEIRSVRLGRDFGARIAVVEGINGDERLVVNPSNDLMGGTSVQVR